MNTMSTETSAEASTPELHVLVLDDEAPIRSLFEAQLKEGGMVVRTAENARQALHLLMREHFDVLVLDMKMDGMDGEVFMQEALKIWPWLGIVIVSGHVDNERRDVARSIGVHRILEKPVSMRVLCDEVRAEGLDRRRQYEALGNDNALALMRDHLRLLQGIDSKVVGSQTLIDILIEFGKTLTGMLDADVVGILSDSDTPTNRELVLLTNHSVSEGLLEQVRDEMIDRYAILSGQRIGGDELNVQVVGDGITTSGDSHIGSSLSVPILLGERFSGLLTLATPREDVYTKTDISLLYHAANHISAVFTTLNQMHHLATRDHLTGLFNRIRLEEELERTWLLSSRYKRPMSVVVVDVDNFKTLNDSFGHAVGDNVLVELGSLLRGAARATDIVARYGGDEFVAILPQAEEHDAVAFAERFLQRLRDSEFCQSTHRFKLTASVGIASNSSEDQPQTGDEILSQADRALYMAKRAGRNRLAIWPDKKPGAGSPSKTEPAAAHAKRILLVDDEHTILELVKRMLTPRGIEVTACSNAVEALEALDAAPGYYDVLLTDLSMPGMSGTELLQEVRNRDEPIVTIVMTGFATVDTAVDSIRVGAYDFIQKPLRMAELTALIQRALEYRNLKIENERYQNHLEEMVRQRGTQLVETLEEVRQAYDFTLDALVAMLDIRESQTGKHSVRAKQLATTLALHMGIDRRDVEAIASGAFLHDIGKIGIPDSILLKPGPLSTAEWETMRSHPEIGYRILGTSPYLKQAAEVVYAHHERFDGKGYPRGLKGSDICIGARIFAVVDAYDAMRSLRCYRESMEEGAVIEEIRTCSGTHFDPEVVDAFLECQPELERIFLEHATDNL